MATFGERLQKAGKMPPKTQQAPQQVAQNKVTYKPNTFGARIQKAEEKKKTNPYAQISKTYQTTQPTQTVQTPAPVSFAEQERRAMADNDTEALIRIRNEQKQIRAQQGAQTLGDRASDVLSTAANATGASLADVLRVGVESYETFDKARAEESIKRLMHTLAVGKTTDGTILTRGMKDNIIASIEKWNEVLKRDNASKLADVADRMQATSGQFQQSGKEGLGTVGSLMFDVGVAGTQMLGDSLVNAIVPGGSLIALGARSLGGGTMEARQNGATLKQQVLSGAATAAVEVATEKMFDGLAGIYGKGAADDVVKAFINKTTTSDAGRRALQLVASMGNEAVEEGVSGIVAPLIQRIYDDQALGQYKSPELYGEIAYDMLVGGILGGVGGSVEALTSPYEYEPPAPNYTNAYTDLQNAQKAQQAAAEEARQNAPLAATNGNAERILADPGALADLQTKTGLAIDDTMTKSQKRTVVKDALRQVAEQATAQKQTVQETADAEYQQRKAALDTGIQKWVDRAKSGLAENGTQTAAEIMPEGANEFEFYSDFTAYYKAGLRGGTIDSARAPAGVMNDAQATQAYNAGRMDAMQSLAKDKASAVVAQESGVKDFESLGDDAGRIDEAAKLLGTSVEVKDQIDGGSAYGKVTGSNVEIERDSERSHVRTIGHEMLAHRVQNLAPAEYRAFRQSLAMQAEVQAKADGMMQLYSERNVTLTYEQALDEAVAEYVGELAEGSDVLDRFIERNRTDRTLLQRIKTAIQDFMHQLKDADYRNARRAVRKLDAALDAAARNAETAKNNTTQNGGVQFSLKEIVGKDGTNYGIGVYLDSDLLTGLTEAESKQMVKARVVDELAGQTFVAYDNGTPVEISVAEKNERIKNVTGKRKPVLKELYDKNSHLEIKREAVVLADELVEASTNQREEASKYSHDWLDNYGQNAWGKRTVVVQDKNNAIWEATLQIANSADGRKILYDIDPIKKTGQAIKLATSTVNDNVSRDADDVNTKFSLKDVDPIEPTDDRWKRGATFAEVKSSHPTLFALEADEADTRNPTQITGTVKSYRKIYDVLKAEGFSGTILDASSGLGYGTKAGIDEYGFDVEDIEPFPDAKYKPKYTDYSKLNKTYDVIINNAVLNVIPQDLRDALVVKMGEMLNPGGRAFINVRGTDVKNASSKVAINEDLMEYFISNTGSYQKGFTPKELVAYLQDALGDGFTVEPTKKFGAVSAIVTKKGEAKQFSASAPVDDVAGGVIAPRYSLKSWGETDQADLERRLKEATGESVRKVRKWMSDVNGVAAMIAADQNRLDYESDRDYTMVKPNAEYYFTLDASTLCAKRRLYQGTYNAIARALGDRAIMPEDTILIRNLLAEHGEETPCAICYVESRRRLLGKFAKKWLNKYDGSYKPTLDEVTTTDGLANLKKTHPEVAEDFLREMNRKGTSNPKVVQPRTDYRGEILSMSKGVVEKVKHIGGFRVQSFSDFETPHMIDMMQAVMDMSAKNLTAQAYTKVPAFARVFGGTGIKINLSLIAAGVDENGTLLLDPVEGMPVDEALEIRRMYSKNVGTIVVVRNDAELKAALNDKRIDFIIPFHKSGWSKAQVAQLGMTEAKDFTRFQNEKDASTGKKVAENLYPADYWDYSKSGKENAEVYLNLCYEQKRTPKFASFLEKDADGRYHLQKDGSTNGYWKLLIDFKMYDNAGRGAPQAEVRPEFNMSEVRKVLDAYEGGADTLPVAQSVVDEFMETYKEKHPNVQYSLKVDDAADIGKLERENQRLALQLEKARRELTITTDANRSVRTGDVAKLTNRIIKSYNSTLQAKEVAPKIKTLLDTLVQGGNYDSVQSAAEDVGYTIVENALVRDDSTYRDYQDMRKRLKSIDIVVSESDAKGIPEGYAAFRKANSGRMHIVRGETSNVDVVFKDLAGRFGEGLFDETKFSNPVDQLLHIADVLDGLKPIYENPYSANLDLAAQYVATEIIDAVFDDTVRETPATYADKQAAKLKEAKESGKAAADRQRLADDMYYGRQMAENKRASNERLKEERATRKESERMLREEKREAVREAREAGVDATQRQRTLDDMYYGRIAAEARKNANARIAAEQEKRAEQIQKLKDHYADVKETARINREIRAERARLLKIARRLKDRKLPAVTRTLLDQYIGDLDTVAVSITGKGLNSLYDLKNAYDVMKQDPDFISDPVTERKLERLQKVSISSMTMEQVADLTDILLNIEHEINEKNKLINDTDRRDTYHMGVEVIRDIENSKGSRGGPVDKYIITEALSPIRFIRRVTGYNDSDPLLKVTKSLQDGQSKMLTYQMRAERPFANFAQDKAFSKMFSGKQAQDITIASGVTITPAMRVSLYLHSLNDANLRHIAGGGITIPDAKLYKQGKIAEAYARGTTIKLKPSEVRAITASMTPKEKAFANAAYKYFNVTSKAAINETSEALKGYSLADVDNYYPINTDTAFTKPNFDELKRDGTIEGMGFLKERVNASNPIMLRDANTVLEQAIQMHSKYVGMAIPVRNFNKIWGVMEVSFDEEGNRVSFDSSVQKAMQQKWGTDSMKYVDKMMSDIQSPKAQDDPFAAAFAKLRSNYAGAILTINIGVAMKQAASYPTAAATLGWKPLARSMGDARKVDLTTIEKYTPLLWYRRKGYATQELGDLAKNNKQIPKALNWIQGVDLLTTETLWKASEYYVRENNKVLQIGSDAYYQSVADVYNRVIQDTQPNYTTMERPQMLRRKDAISQGIGMFKTQPFQNFNILYDAAANYKAKSSMAKQSNTAENVAAAKKAKTDFRNAMTSQAAQLIVFAAMSMVADALKGKLDKYEDKEGNLTLSSAAPVIAKSIVSGVMGMIPMGGEFQSIMQSLVFGDRFYGMSLSSIDLYNDTVEAGLAAKKNADAMLDGDLSAGRAFMLIENASDLLQIAGWPTKNAKQTALSLYKATLDAYEGKYLGEYYYMRLTAPYKTKNDSGVYVTTDAYKNLMYRALSDGAYDEYQEIFDSLTSDGVNADSIADAMRSKYNKHLKENPNYSLNERAANMIGVRPKYGEGKEEDEKYSVENLDSASYKRYNAQRTKSYERVSNDIESSGYFKEVDGDTKDKLLQMAEKMAHEKALEDNSNGQYKVDTAWVNWVSNGDAYGVDEMEAILFKSIVDNTEADKDKNGNNVSGSKQKKALKEAAQQLSWLTPEELKYLQAMFWTTNDKNLKALKEAGFSN